MNAIEFKEKLRALGGDVDAFSENLKLQKNRTVCQHVRRVRESGVTNEFYSIIDRAFTWSITPQGKSYWEKLSHGHSVTSQISD